MDKNLKQLENKEDIIIPEKFNKMFEETLENLPNKKTYKSSPHKIAASIVLTLAIGSGVVLAITDNRYKYAPVEGILIDSENSIYGLYEPIVQLDHNGEEIELEMMIDEDYNRVRVSTSGEFNVPKSEKAELKIGNKVYKNKRINLSELNYTWGAIDTFDGIKKYSEGEEIVYTIYMDGEHKVEFNISLKELNGFDELSDIGILVEDKGIPITAIVNEKKDNLVVDFFTDSQDYSAMVGSGGIDSEFTNIHLLDANGKRIYGKKEISGGSIKTNRVKISTENLEKPYRLVVPEVRIDLFKEDEASILSETIDLKIPKKGETVEINKEILIDIGNEIIDTENKKVKLKRATRENDRLILEVEYVDNEKDKDRLNQVVLVKENILTKDELYYANSEFDNNKELKHYITLDLNRFERNIKFKLSPITYFIKGKWEFNIQ